MNSNTRFYDDPGFGVEQMTVLPGNDLTTLLLTPQAGTGGETKTHTTTCEEFAPGRKIRLLKLVYSVVTARTGAGCTLALDVYNGTTSVGSLSVTDEAAGASAVMSTPINSEVASTGYVRVIAKSTTTASDANSATGLMQLIYQEMYS